MLSRHIRPGGSTRPRIEYPVIDLPDPDSPTMPRIARALTREASRPVHRHHHPRLGEEVGAQALDLEERAALTAAFIASGAGS
jgi:hypothetical protein